MSKQTRDVLLYVAVAAVAFGGVAGLVKGAEWWDARYQPTDAQGPNPILAGESSMASWTVSGAGAGPSRGLRNPHG